MRSPAQLNPWEEIRIWNLATTIVNVSAVRCDQIIPAHEVERAG
jgi:hypothetical protein